MIPFTTVSGRRIDLSRPDPQDFILTDIATGLSNTSRFSGQVTEMYSVAQHSLLVAALLPQRLKGRGLMHDASEAYMNDLSRHLKHSPELEGYRRLEAGVQHAIELRFFGGITPEGCLDHTRIKLADDLAAAFEHTVLRRNLRWKAVEAIPYLMGRGFIKGDAQRQRNLIDLAHMSLPDGISYQAEPPKVARARFLRDARWALGLAWA